MREQINEILDKIESREKLANTIIGVFVYSTSILAVVLSLVSLILVI